MNELMEICIKLSDMVLSLEKIKANQAAVIEKLKKRVKKLEGRKKKRTHGLKRLYKGRIAEIDDDEDISLINVTTQDQGRINEEDMFGVQDLDGDEVIVDVTAEGYKQKDIKEKTFDAIKKMFEKVYKRVNTFVDMNTKIVEESLKKTQAKVTKGSSKRAGDEIEQECTKKQKLDENVQAEVADDNTIELKRCMEIVPEDDDEVYKRVNTFVDMNTEIVEESLKKTQAKVTKGSSKRARDEIEQECTKKQKLDENVQAEVADDNTIELKRCMEIVPEDDDEVTIEATPLSFKSPTIVDYNI
nr:hypothetical protein [Tanacetum cinerariifolium]